MSNNCRALQAAGKARLDQDPLLTSVPEAEGYKGHVTVVIYQERGNPGHGKPKSRQESTGDTEGGAKP